MKKIFTRKRRNWALGITTAIAAALLAGSLYLDSWRSPQYAAYNMGIRLYSAGDHMCNRQEAVDPIANRCIDINLATRVFGGSMQAFAAQSRNANFVEQLLLPPPSRELAALAALHQGVLALMGQRAEDAVKAFKLAISLADTSEEDAIVASGGVLDAHTQREVARLRAIKLTAQYDLELLFKNNPSQAQAQGRGDPRNRQPGNQPDQGRPQDGPPTEGSGKPNNNRI